MTFDPVDVIVHLKEPFSKNTVWIQPIDGIINVKLYYKGKWNIIYTTQDKGLSDVALQQVEELVTTLGTTLVERMNKQLGKCSQNTISFLAKQKEMESRIDDLETKLKKLTNRYSTLLLNKGKK